MLVTISVALFFIAMLALGWFARGNVDTIEDFVVAGRRLPLTLAVPTVLATWFGAGTLLVAADEVHARGLSGAALDPIGAGLCLLIAGALLARPLWRMKLTTLPDFFLRVFGPRAERWAGVLQVPGYLGWVAAQYTALALILTNASGVPLSIMVAVVALVGLIYTLLGGMWAVTWTDAAQMVLLVIGLLVMFAIMLVELGDGASFAGFARLVREVPRDRLALVAPGEAAAFTTALLAGSLGNVPSQDLTQRMFAARSETVAQRACLISGGLYLTLGMIPVLLALGAGLLVPEAPSEGILAALAAAILHPAVAWIFSLTVAAAVLSSIDSGILAPATVLARNVLVPFGMTESVRLHRICVAIVAVAALVIAYLGEDTYALLEASYEIGMVTLLVPLVLGVYWPRGPSACLAAMLVGTAIWGAHMLLGVDGLLGTGFPMGLGATLAALAAYAATPRSSPPDSG